MKSKTMNRGLSLVGSASIFDKISFRKSEDVLKGWGKEVHVANNFFPHKEGGYCGKFLTYLKVGALSSMHFHGKKHETFYVLNGEFLFRYIDPETANVIERPLVEGDIVEIPPLCAHQVKCVRVGAIIEFSTTDYSDDNYRVAKGDSQK